MDDWRLFERRMVLDEYLGDRSGVQYAKINNLFYHAMHHDERLLILHRDEVEEEAKKVFLNKWRGHKDLPAFKEARKVLGLLERDNFSTEELQSLFQAILKEETPQTIICTMGKLLPPIEIDDYWVFPTKDAERKKMRRLVK